MQLQKKSDRNHFDIIEALNKFITDKFLTWQSQNQKV